MAGGIFVSYRRDDSRQAAGRLAENLAEHFGEKRIFRDIETIELGVDFTKALNQALGSCVVMLVLIGRDWLTVHDAQGARRLDDPKDWIRQEIVTALERDIRVVPVLVDGAALPDEGDLPADLQPLVRRQALEMEDGRWKGDLQRLVTMLAKLPGLQPIEPPRPDPGPTPKPVPPPLPEPKPSRKKMWVWSGVAALVVLALIDAQYEGGDAPEPLLPPPIAVQPALQQPDQPPVQQPAPGLPDLNGSWRSADGTETYEFTQHGTQLRIAAFMRGTNVGGGAGELQGQFLSVNLSLQMQGVNMANANCNLQASPDFRAFSGVCVGPSGQYPVHLFR